MAIWTPHLMVDRVNELTPARLAGMGLRSLLLDVDCTLKRYRHEELTAEAAAWLADLQAAEISFCLVSNGRGPRIARVAQRHGVPYVAMAMKPLPWGCLRAIRQQGFDRRQTAMVGDQVLADILAGRLAGVRTILVRPIHPEDEPWYTRLKRPLERWLLGRLKPPRD